MRIRNGQDFAAGAFFIAIGAAALWISADYPLGTAIRLDTGVLPTILGWCLIATGGILAGKAVAIDGPPLGEWAWRPALMVTLAAVSFALLVDRIGLILTMAVTMTLTALGTHETRWREYLLFAVFMIAFGVGVFIYGLGMPIPVLPPEWTWR